MALTIKGGTGQPKIVWAGGAETLPYPQKMMEKFDEKSIHHVLIDQQVKKYVQGFRYSVQLVWDFLNEDSDEVGDILEILNYLAGDEDRTVQFYPHNDNDFYVDAILGGDFALGKVGSKQKYTGHSLKMKLESQSLLPALPFAWVSPNDYDDPDSAWTDEINAFDDDILTYTSATAPVGDYTKYLHLFFPGQVLANKIRYRCDSTYTASIEIDGYDGSTWTSLVNTSAISGSWQEASFTAQKIEELRVRFKDTAAVADNAVKIYEVDLGIF